jgi:drug/metabolite transporter (DMT)-like permease
MNQANNINQAHANASQMNRKRGIISLLVSTTGLGLAGLLTRGATRVDFFGNQYVAGQSIGAFMTLGRMLAAFILFTILLFATRKIQLFKQTRLTPSIVLGGVTVGIGLTFYLVATLLTTLADAVFLIYTGPLFCTILARIFRKEKINALQGICLLAVFIGMLFTSEILKISEGGLELAFSFSSTNSDYPQKGLGDIFGLLSGIFYGISLFFNGYRRDCDTTVRGVWNFLFASIASFCVAFTLSYFWPLGEISMQPINWIFAILLWLICGPLGLGLLLVAGKNLPAIEYSTIAYWECIVSICAGVLVFGETLTMPTIIGGALILIGGALPIFIPNHK